MKARLLNYMNNDRHYWWTVAVFPGLYALLYLYKTNYTLVNSVEQLLGLTAQFIVLPVIGFLTLDLIFKRFLISYRNHLYFSFLFISLSSFISLTVFMGWRWKALLLLAALVITTSFFLAKHYKKAVLLLGFMTAIATGQLLYFYLTRIAPQEEWVQRMPFEQLKFAKTPNIYVIQPDGYVGKETLQRSPYTADNADFYRVMDSIGFAFNHQYRSNYYSTLTSNAALFTGQHHYFRYGVHSKELLGAREDIIGPNPVLRTLKNNDYTLNLITGTTYFYTNYAAPFYDHSNIQEEDLSFFPYFKQGLDVLTPLKKQLDKIHETPQFTFIEFLSPAHISVTESQSRGVAGERAIYLDRLEDANRQLANMIELINDNDPEAIIVLVADHGGFVGLHYTGEAYLNPTDDFTIKNSIYSALFAIKAPANFIQYRKAIKSSVGVFPNLFAYLSDQQPVEVVDDGSYIQVPQGSKKGVYRYFDAQGNTTTQLVKRPTAN